MDLKGKDVFQATQREIWDLLMDPDLLAKITPGVSRLEKIGADKYTAVADVKIGPVKASFKGKLDLENKNEPEKFDLNVQQNSKVGNVKALVSIVLKELSPQETELSFAGEAKMSGLLARTGSRVVSGVASSLTKQFFSALKEEIEKQKKIKNET